MHFTRIFHRVPGVLGPHDIDVALQIDLVLGQDGGPAGRSGSGWWGRDLKLTRT
jgi:hypothetical protein